MDFINVATGESVEALATGLEAYNDAGATGKFQGWILYVTANHQMIGVNSYVASTLKLKSETPTLILSVF